MLHAHARTSLGLEVGERTLRDLRTLYQATVRQVDASVGRLLDAVDAAGVADDTAVLLAGDHGEEFQEHGHLAHYPKLYDELIHVPFIANVPGLDGGRIDRHVGLDAIRPPSPTCSVSNRRTRGTVTPSFRPCVARTTPPLPLTPPLSTTTPRATTPQTTTLLTTDSPTTRSSPSRSAART